MSRDFYEIMKEHNVHHLFINESGIVSALEKTYKMGAEDVLNWLLKQDHLCENIQYLVEEWNNQNEK